MKNQEITMRNAQSGSIFIWIFVMIALFGALSFTMMQGSRTGGSNIDAERGKLVASELLDYATGMKNAIRMMRTGGCRLEQISFYSDQWLVPAVYDNANTPFASDDFSCHVFHPQGGGIKFLAPPEGFPPQSEFYYTTSLDIVDVGSGTGSLVMIMRYTDENVCRGINDILGVQSFARDAYFNGMFYDGTVPVSNAAIGDDNDNPEYVAGKQAGCMRVLDMGVDDPQPEDTYFFYYVLEAR